MAAGVDWVGVAELLVGLGLVDVGEALVVVGAALVVVAALLLAGVCGNRIPAWVSMTPTSANSTSRIRAISGQVQGLRPRRSGSLTGSS